MVGRDYISLPKIHGTMNKTLQCNTILPSLTWSLHFWQHINSWNLFQTSLSKLREKKYMYTALTAIFLIYKILILEAAEDPKLQLSSWIISTFVLLILWASCSSSIRKFHQKQISHYKKKQRLLKRVLLLDTEYDVTVFLMVTSKFYFIVIPSKDV